MKSPFRYFKTSPEIIRLAVMMHVRFPLSLRHVEDLLHERRIEVSHETIRFSWNRCFRRMRSLQKFATIHSSVYNHFNLRRHLCSRDHFKIKRAAAIAQWRQIAAA